MHCTEKRIVTQLLDPDCFRHLLPAAVLLPFKPPEIYRRHRKRAVVEKAADILDRFADITP